MRSNVIVVIPPVFDHDPCFDTIAEPFHRQAFIPKLAVEALVGSVLPRLARIDEDGFDLLLHHPSQQGRADKFRSIVGADIARRTMQADEPAQHLDHSGTAD